jgi:hypothetical protein
VNVAKMMFGIFTLTQADAFLRGTRIVAVIAGYALEGCLTV